MTDTNAIGKVRVLLEAQEAELTRQSRASV